MLGRKSTRPRVCLAAILLDREFVRTCSASTCLNVLGGYLLGHAWTILISLPCHLPFALLKSLLRCKSSQPRACLAVFGRESSRSQLYLAMLNRKSVRARICSALLGRESARLQACSGAIMLVREPTWAQFCLTSGLRGPQPMHLLTYASVLKTLSLKIYLYQTKGAATIFQKKYA